MAEPEMVYRALDRRKEKEMAELMNSDWQEAAKQLLELKITQLARQTIPEAVYDVAMYHDKNNKRLLSDKYAWLASLRPDDGSLVALGAFDARGVLGGRWMPSSRLDDLGVSLSRRL